MLFSIIVPVYNVEKYINECIESILSQTFSDFEVILVDDGSTDNSGLICDEYAEKDNRIKVVHKRNEGLLLARRTGLKACNGDYIIHCDSDDYISSDLLFEISNEILDKHPDMILYGYDVVDDNHCILEEHFRVFDDQSYFDKNNKESILLQLCSTTWLNNMVTKATRRELIDIDSDYNEYKSLKMGEDLFQVIPLIKNCSTFVYIAKPFYFYRYNLSGMSKNINRSYLDNHIIVSERMNNLLIDECVTEDIKISFYNRYVKDVYKYLLRFLKSDISKSEYLELISILDSNDIYISAQKYFDKWSKENKLLRSFIKPSNYSLNKFLSKTVLSRVL